MQIERECHGELLELRVEGRLDNESSTHFRDAVDQAVHEGWHRILIDLSGVAFLSSAGIGALLKAKRQLDQLHGLFGVCRPTGPIERVLSQTRVLDVLLCDPEIVKSRSGASTATWPAAPAFSTESGLALTTYRNPEDSGFVCRVVGDPDPMFSSHFDPQHCRTVAFPPASIGVGLGGLGDHGDAIPAQFGEFLSAAGAVGLSSASEGVLPDYSIAREQFIPEVQVLYGLTCQGGFSHLIRFEPVHPGGSAPVSDLVAQSMQASGCSSAGFVMIAESAGLAAARLRQSPTKDPTPTGDPTDAATRFDFPQIRQWLSFSSEQVHRRTLVLVVGVVQRGASGALSAASSMLRPIDKNGELHGHLHAAAFPYRPLKKGTLELPLLVNELFEAGAIIDVVHLLRDDRPGVGAGESALAGGACWIGPIDQAAPWEEQA